MYYINISPTGNNTYIRRDEQGLTMFVDDEGNRDYQAYLAWVAEGNTAKEWNPEESAPTDEA